MKILLLQSVSPIIRVKVSDSQSVKITCRPLWLIYYEGCGPAQLR